MAWVHFYLGESYLKSGNLKQAAPSYLKALSLNPGLAEAELGLGITYTRLHQPKHALFYLQKVIQRDSNNITLYTLMAVQSYEKTLPLNPNHTGARFKLNLIQVSMKGKDPMPVSTPAPLFCASPYTGRMILRLFNTQIAPQTS